MSVKTSHEPNEQLPIDTTGMNRGQRAAMEVAESARDTADSRDGFAGELFMGRLDPHRLLPFPAQDDEDRAIGDEMVRKVSALLSERLDPEAVDETRTIPVEVVDGLRALGIFRMKVPKEYGGLGFSQVNYNRVIMAIASYCGSTAVLVSAHQSIGLAQPLKMFGTAAQKAKYLPRISQGDLSAFALTEVDVGSDPARMTTTAKLSDDGRFYVLNGDKLWTTNGPIAQVLVVMAQTAPKIVRGRERAQITAFIVETDTPGIEFVHRCDFMGLRAIHNGLMRFTDVKVPAENVLWGEGLGLKLALKTLNAGRLTLPAAAAGAAKLCLSIVRRWGNQRVQWGLPIGRHEAGAEKIAYIAPTAFAMEAMVWLTSHWADEARDIRIEAAMAKLFCSEACWRIVDQTMQFRGGRGYERASSLRARGETAYPVERMMRDCRINTIIEGTSEIMRLFLAREALDPHLRAATRVLGNGLPWTGKLRAAAGLVGFYGGWYPSQLLGRRWPKRYRSMGRLARHWRYMDRTSHRLAAALFHAMARHRQKLERRQILLGHLVDVGTELFAMATACAYAQSSPARGGEGGSQPLADLFCRQARRRIEDHFRAMRRNDQRRANLLAKGVLAGAFEWMEAGIIGTGLDDGPEASSE
jgi:alkylation response protein AidB-like acyl-CoA dehydrogenase